MRSMRRLTTRGWAHGAMGVRAKALTVVGPRPRGCDIGLHGVGFVAVPGRPARLGDVSVWGWTRWAVRCAGFPGLGSGCPAPVLSLFGCREDLFGSREDLFDGTLDLSERRESLFGRTLVLTERRETLFGGTLGLSER